MNERPGKVTAAAVLLFIPAAVTLFGSVMVLYLASRITGTDPETGLTPTELVAAALITILFALAYVALGVLLLLGVRWARVTTIVAVVFGVAVTVTSSVLTGDWRGTGCGFLLPIITIALLMSEDAKHYFRKPEPEPALPPFPY